MKCQIMFHGYRDYIEGEMWVSFFSLEEEVGEKIFDKTMRLTGHFTDSSKLDHSSVDRLFHFLELYNISVDIQEETDYWEMSFNYLGNVDKDNTIKLRFYSNYARLFLNGVCRDQIDLVCLGLARQEEKRVKMLCDEYLKNNK